MNLSLLTAAVAVAGFVSLYVPHDLGFVTPIWAPNAMTLAFVLRNPGGGPRWLGVLAGFCGLFASSLAIGDDVATSLVLSSCNMLEVTICAVGLRRLIGEPFDPGRVRHLAYGAALAVVGSFAGATVSSTYLSLLRGRHVLTGLTVWTLSDALGLLILTPCLLILIDWRRYVTERRVTAAGWAMLALAAVFEAALFGQTRYPLLFLAPLPALAGAIALEMVGAAVLVLVIAVASIGFTLAGHGPIALVIHGWTERLILLQLFIVVCTCLSLNAAAMQRRQRESARRLSAALAEAEQAARVKSEFLANMSHEIRTPLTSILGFAALLAERDLGEEADRYAQRVLGASRNLLALVNDVLDFSKLEAGRLELKPTAGDPDECGRDVVELFANQAAEKGLSLAFHACGAQVRLEADFDRVRQVLMNLVGNGVKFTRAGAVTVDCAYDPDRGRLAYRVRDTGAGLDAEAQGKLFRRFSQVDATVNRQHGGSGLGLAISKGLVEAMGGRIGVESAPGEGAVFWFEILVRAAPAEAEAAGPELDLAAFAGLKVLLVDDNAANR
jgi:signal transduction histidine kinase